MHHWIRCGSLLVIAAGLLSTGANAQAWLGLMVGEMAAQQAAAAREEQCRKGVPADPSDVKSSNKRADKLMDSYFALTSKSSKRDIAALFDSEHKDASWKDDNGPVAITDLGAQLDELSDKHTKILAVVGGDNQTMRMIWSVGEGTDTVYYGVDIINGSFWNNSHIWHMTVSKTQPDTPPAYCHFDPEQRF